MKNFYIEVVYNHSFSEIWIVPETPETITKDWLEEKGQCIASISNISQYIKDFSHYQIAAVYKQVSLKTFKKEQKGV